MAPEINKRLATGDQSVAERGIKRARIERDSAAGDTGENELQALAATSHSGEPVVLSAPEPEKPNALDSADRMDSMVSPISVHSNIPVIFYIKKDFVDCNDGNAQVQAADHHAEASSSSTQKSPEDNIASEGPLNGKHDESSDGNMAPVAKNAPGEDAPDQPPWFAPFTSASAFRFVAWAKDSIGKENSDEDLQKLVDEVFLAPDFKKEDVGDLDLEKEIKRWDELPEQVIEKCKQGARDNFQIRTKTSEASAS